MPEDSNELRNAACGNGSEQLAGGGATSAADCRGDLSMSFRRAIRPYLPIALTTCVLVALYLALYDRPAAAGERPLKGNFGGDVVATAEYRHPALDDRSIAIHSISATYPVLAGLILAYFMWMRCRAVRLREANRRLELEIAERRRTESALRLEEARMEALLALSQMAGVTRQEITDRALEEAVRLTGSSMGYFGFLNEDESVLTMASWSKTAMVECAMAEKSFVFPVKTMGLWGEAVRQRKPIVTNDYRACNPMKKGCPSGHVPIRRHMNVPVFDGTRIVAVMGVANKRTDYDESDVRQLRLMANGAWRILRRQEAEEALRNGRYELEQRVRERTAELRRANEKLQVEIAARSKIEADLRRSEERYRDLVENLPIGLYRNTPGPQGRFVMANPAVAAMFGYDTVEAFMQVSVADLYADPAERAAFSDRLLAEGQVIAQDLRLKRRDGTALWATVTARVCRDEAGNIIYFDGLIQDVTDRKAAEQALRDSERKLSAITTAAQDAIVMIDNDGNARFWNPAAERILGYTAAEVLGRNLHAIIAPPAYREAHARAFEVFRISGHGPAVGRTLELTALRKDGEEVPVELSLSAVQDGGVWCAIGIMRDIRRRKQAEEKLRLQNRALEAAANGIAIIDRTGRITWVNPAFTRLTGYGFDEAIGANPRILKSGVHGEGFYRELWETITAGRVWHGELVNRRKDGTLYAEEMTITPVPDAAGEITHFVAVKQDVTERRRSEDALRREHESRAAILNAISSILIGADQAGTVTLWNMAAEAAFGIPAGQAIGRPLRELPIRWSWPPILEGVAACLAGRRVHRLDDIRFTRSDGQEGFLGVTISPIAGGNDQVSGFLLAGTDITDRRILEAQLSQSQKLESIGQLAAGIAHEINTPTQFVGDNTRFLRDAFGDVQRLLDKYRELLAAAQADAALADLAAQVQALQAEVDLDYLSAEIPKAVEQSLEGVGRVAKIVRAMKEFSHPGGEEKRSIDLNKAIESTVTVARNEWKYVAELETDLDPSLPPVPCLPGEFNQVILNLIINAAHTIADVVGRGGETKGRIRVTTRRDGDWVEIRVADTGTGIPEAIRSRVFEPFFTTKEVGKGTGQGLAIAHNVVVKKHGGTISLETEVGKGTTFIIRLPLQPEAKRSEAAAEVAGHEEAHPVCG